MGLTSARSMAGDGGCAMGLRSDLDASRGSGKPDDDLEGGAVMVGLTSRGCDEASGILTSFRRTGNRSLKSKISLRDKPRTFGSRMLGDGRRISDRSALASRETTHSS